MKSNRVASVERLNSTARREYDSLQDDATVTPLVFTSGSPSYSSYRDCYNQVLSKAATGTSGRKWSQVREFFRSGGFDFLSDAESKYDCASICEVPLFYVTRDISEGLPT